MTPVINPLWFYLMSVADDVDFVASVVVVVTTIGLTIYFFYSLANAYDVEDFIDNLKPIRKPFAIVVVLITLVGIITPSSETITKMIIAQNVTYERVEVVGDTVETVYNDIMALFEDNNSEGETE